MAGTNLNMITITANVHRIKSKEKIVELKSLLQKFNPSVVYIQEIGVMMAMEIFRSNYQVFVNLEEDAMDGDGIGIATIIKEGIDVRDIIIGSEGRTIGLKTGNAQFWNIYPKSGSGEKKWRENFFREVLPNMMTNWKDHTDFLSMGGDVNCTHRKKDSENNQEQHFQAGLRDFLSTFNLKDDYVRLHGEENPVRFSRITNRSKTRIDILTSTLDLCNSFRYWEPGLTGYDHKFGIAEYNIDMEVEKEFIPKERRHFSWAFPRELEVDELFLEKAKEICDTVQQEIEAEEVEELQVDMTRKWNYMKKRFVKEAKTRSVELRREEDGRKNALRAFLYISMQKIEAGIDDFENFKRIRNELRLIWQKKTQRILEKNKTTEIEDHIYDIHKLEKQKKFENGSKIRKLNMEGNTYEGTLDILDAMESKIKREVEDFETDMDSEPTEEEVEFLMEMDCLSFSDEEKEEVIGPVAEKECEEIFKDQVNLDSSPGPDGCTYRLYYCLFKKFQSFRILFLRLINYTKDRSSLGNLQNLGVLKVINKKRFSEEYDGKRKLMIINKDVNFIAKIWVNRFQIFVLPKCLPKTQYNCQEDINIVDENRAIRDVVRHLRGDDDGEEKDGTLLAIDFRDAFRSVLLRWFKLVLEYLEVPVKFRSWFWSFYKDLSIMIVINGAKSNNISVNRGFMEGNPPSMAAFVTAIIPLLNCLERSVKGITISSGSVKKLFGFADDLKLVLRDPEEIHVIYEIISRFQDVSGLSMHMDPNRKKCQALCFGSHRNYDHWPIWISKQDIVNILGVLYSNVKEKTLEQVNSENIKNKVLKKLFAASGIRGTILQKTVYANVFLLSKVWYVTQSIILDSKMLMELDRQIRRFIFAGENERPVQPILYRSRAAGGLQLICACTKARSFMVKGMLEQQEEKDASGASEWIVYGNKRDLDILMSSTVNFSSIQQIYQHLLQAKIGTEDNLIKSRAELRNPQVNWKAAWKNLKCLRGVTAEVKCFAWKLQQDMVHVPSRNHRKGTSKDCNMLVYDDMDNQMVQCGRFGDLKHSLADCRATKDKFGEFKSVLREFLNKSSSSEEIIFLSFRHWDKKRLKLAIWSAVIGMFYIFRNKDAGTSDMLLYLRKELFFHVLLERWFAGRVNMSKMMDVLNRKIGGV